MSAPLKLGTNGPSLQHLATDVATDVASDGSEFWLCAVSVVRFSVRRPHHARTGVNCSIRPIFRTTFTLTQAQWTLKQLQYITSSNHLRMHLARVL